MPQQKYRLAGELASTTQCWPCQEAFEEVASDCCLFVQVLVITREPFGHFDFECNYDDVADELMALFQQLEQ